VASSVDDVKVSASIDMSSVDTNNADRDQHLQTTDLFDADKHLGITEAQRCDEVDIRRCVGAATTARCARSSTGWPQVVAAGRPRPPPSATARCHAPRTRSCRPASTTS
jgi:hypothetical protein